MFGWLKKIFGTAQDRQIRRFKGVVKQINEWEQKFLELSEEQLKEKTTEFKKRLKEGETLDMLLPEAYAVVKCGCRKLCGKAISVSGYDHHWNMIPYDVQLIGAIGMHKGVIAEMQTGEGKTLTATLPLYLNALTEKPVHTVTVNDYLAERDCQLMGTLLTLLGVTSAALVNSTPSHKRKKVYEANVVYGTSSEFGFDYLRDNSMANSKDEQVQRGYYFALVDEVDSILIDEARTPLIISGPAAKSRQMYDQLKDGVAALVGKQRDFCATLATEARKVIQDLGTVVGKKSKEQDALYEGACKKLWLLSKGTPRNKIYRRMLEDPDIRAAVDQWDLYFYGDAAKAEKQTLLANLFIIVDEKASDYELTDKGIAEWSKFTGSDQDEFTLIDLADAYFTIDADSSLSDEQKMEQKLKLREQDAIQKERAHNLRQMLRAQLLMEKDVDYMVEDGKVIIIDENTGRPQPGRRFSDGLHQSIEAKEGCSIQAETQTYATITLQNYFRLYEKLSGMTGTGSTEAHEFKAIYKLDVLEIPTNKPRICKDFNDEIYMTEREKYAAILKDIQTVHATERPILIGTESLDISEKLSRILRQAKIEHTVLNARQNSQEAEVIAKAGQRGAIMVATNMAGRGTDIKLGEGIAQLGGLYVIGTSRHQSRRIDRQLRGRCARQGDPGSSKFYVSFEDPLMRLFASPRLTSVLQRFRPPEGEPISAGILNRSIETAQKRVEGRNFTMREHTLKYDDVMNKQRQEIYSFRNEILHTNDIVEMALGLIENTVAQGAELFLISRGEEGGWDPEGYRRWLANQFPVSFEEGALDHDDLEREEIAAIAAKRVIALFKGRLDQEIAKLDPNGLPNGNAQLTVADAIRDILLRKVDTLWKEHLHTMDHLRSDVGLRAVAQKDPLMEFKTEAFELFGQLSHRLHTEVAQDLFRFEVVIDQHPAITELLKQLRLETGRSFLDTDNAQK